MRFLPLYVLAALLIMALVQFRWSYNDEPWVIEANGASIVVPTYGVAFGKAVRRSVHGRLTKEQTETFASAMMVVTKAVLYSNSRNWTLNLEGEFPKADVTFFYEYLREHSIKDRRGGFHAIRDWNITPTAIAFTLYKSMRNVSDDGYWQGDEDYEIKIRYHFAADDQTHWAFLKNEVIGFSRDSKE
tara:strand:+ start:286 stop:846 length:561 start_codon:yes stop_codon:yes gene_type:complete